MLLDIGLLALRVCFGTMLAVGHGLHKLKAFSTIAPHFPDPLHVGGTISLALTVFAEVFCSGFVVFGIATRWASIPIFITMAVAIVMVHAGTPWASREPAAVYGVFALTLFLTGPGRLSLDSIFGWVKR